MIESIGSLIAGIVGFYSAFWKRKPESFEPKTRFVDRTLDPNYPRGFLIWRPWNGKSRGPTPPRTPKPPQKES